MLETSMDVEPTVDLIPDERIATPRVESPTHVMTVAQVLGTAAEIVVNEGADRNGGIVVRLAKGRLQGIPGKPAEKASRAENGR